MRSVLVILYRPQLVLPLLLLSLLPLKVSAQAFDGDDDEKVLAGYINAGGCSGFTLGYDRGLNDYLSLGCFLSIVEKGGKHDDSGGLERCDLYFAGNYHFQELLKLPSPLDIYTGVSLGLRAAGVQGGVRYNFGEVVGIYAEARQNLLNTIKSSGDGANYYYKDFCFSAGFTFTF